MKWMQNREVFWFRSLQMDVPHVLLNGYLQNKSTKNILNDTLSLKEEPWIVLISGVEVRPSGAITDLNF